ncbi:MAG: peptidylprolyl isomerase [Candidatus Marinimicrobia bacterium]|nr:peptidylprolyl isomerase [Candidatus Neomarinimicrobiota bacterium]
MIKQSIFSLLLLVLLTHSQELIDGIVAVVGDNAILRSDLEQFARINASQMKIDPIRDQDKYIELVNKSLNVLIEENILLEEAKIESIEVKDRDVENMLENQIQEMITQAGSRERAEEMLGSPIFKIKRDYRPIIKKRLIVETLRSEKFKNITVSRREVNDFYNVFKDSLPEVPPSLDFSHILIDISPGEKEENETKEKADSILNLLKSGEDFGRLARLYSNDPGSATEGGNLGYINRGGFIKSFEKVAFSLHKDEISGIVKTDFGYHIIQQVDRKGEKINVRHILITPKISDQNILDSEKLSNDIHQNIINGSITFDSAAVRYSDDKDSKTNKGRIERIPKNQIQNPVFLSVLDNLEVGQLSSVFKTDLGFHILKLNNVYDDTWVIIEQWALEYKKSKLYQKWINDLKSQFYIDIKSSL